MEVTNCCTSHDKQSDVKAAMALILVVWRWMKKGWGLATGWG